MRDWIIAGLVLILLAGCMAPTGPFPPTQLHAVDSTGVAPGVTLEGRVASCDESLCMTLWANHTGSNTYRVSNMCQPPWSESMTQGGEPVAHREPMFYCMAFGLGPFGPGDQLQISYQWNGTLWQDPGHAPAPSGDYQWRGTFALYDEEGGERWVLENRFPITVQ